MTSSVERMEIERLKKGFGESFEKVVEVAEILENHPARLEILAYLSSRSR